MVELLAHIAVFGFAFGIGHTQPRHYGHLCELDHWCPACEDDTGPCVDLFLHPVCGLVACATPEDDKP